MRSMMRQPLFTLACVLLSACGAPEGGPKTGTPAPRFEARYVDGSTRRFPEDFAGQPVIVDFWAEWCQYCPDSMQRLDRARREHADVGLEVIAVNVGPDQAPAAACIDKLGLGYDVLKEINPRIIYAAVSGFGCYGPYHLRPGYDILAQAMGGMMSITGSKGGEPTRAGSALGDILGGLHVTIGILAAVNARTITGKGQRVDVSLMDSMIAATENTALKYLETGNIPAPMGNRYAAVSPYDSFTCKGGKVIIAAGNQKLYEKLCNEVLERPDMITDPRFVDMPGRLANQDAIAEVIEERIKDLTPNEAAELVLAHGIPAGPIMNIKEILDDPHVKEREMFVEMDHPTLGKVTVNGCAIKLMDTKPSVRTPAPQLGQNNRDIFEGVLGMTEEQFNTLHEKQVF